MMRAGQFRSVPENSRFRSRENSIGSRVGRLGEILATLSTRYDVKTNARAVTRPILEPREQFDVVFVGDIILAQIYDERTERVLPLLSDADLVIANLPASLTTGGEGPSGIIVDQTWTWPNLAGVLKKLQTNNVGLVTLADDNSASISLRAFSEMLELLHSSNIETIGAGVSLREAHRPFRASAELASRADNWGREKFSLCVLNAYSNDRRSAMWTKRVGTGRRPVFASLEPARIATRIRNLKKMRPNEFVVVSVHWQPRKRWRSQRQADVASALVDAGADLVVGHGSQLLQEIEKFSGRWVLHGIGCFETYGGNDDASEGEYSLVTRLTASYGQIWLRLYPISTKDLSSDRGPQPIKEHEFHALADLLAKRSGAPGAFQKDLHRTVDQYGPCFITQLRGGT